MSLILGAGLSLAIFGGLVWSRWRRISSRRPSRQGTLGAISSAALAEIVYRHGQQGDLP